MKKLKDLLCENLDHQYYKTKNTQPEYFCMTHYALPTQQQMQQFKKCPNLTPEDICSGIVYNIVGRGILRKEQNKMIEEVFDMFITKYPQDSRYEQALELYKNSRRIR